MAISNQCKCLCGCTEFEVTDEPVFRMLCHCTLCQQFNQAPYADILIFKSHQVIAPEGGVVSFSTYKRPPNVQRGKCSKCGQAAIEVFSMPLMPKLTMVPAGMFPQSVNLPQPKAHMFYEKRVTDANDDLPIHHGFISSQLAFFKYLWTSS